MIRQRYAPLVPLGERLPTPAPAVLVGDGCWFERGCAAADPAATDADGIRDVTGAVRLVATLGVKPLLSLPVEAALTPPPPLLAPSPGRSLSDRSEPSPASDARRGAEEVGNVLPGGTRVADG
jgi:hypothetical protein